MRSWISGLLAATMIVAAPVASASTLQIMPISIEVPAPGAASTITISNPGAETVNAQIRIFKWVQQGGEDQMVPTTDVRPGNYGWRVSKGLGRRPFTSADADYQSTKGLLQAKAFQQGTAASFAVALDGSAALAGGGIFLGNRIDEAFAVVDAGTPNVPVQLENRPVGTTASDGKLLVTGLKAYQKNKISIEIGNLPVMADIPKTETMVVPRENSGVKVDFGIKTRTTAAIVIVTDESGKVLPAGSTLTIKGQQDPVLVGFDGQVYVSGLAMRNEFESTVNSVVCSGHFEFTPGKDEQQVIGPVKCS